MKAATGWIKTSIINDNATPQVALFFVKLGVVARLRRISR